MGCNCKKPKPPVKPAKPPVPTQKAGQTQKFTLETGTGRTLSFGSRLERDAARARMGRGGR